MLEQKIFKVDTQSIAAHLMLRMSAMGLTTTLQNLGSFIDSSKSELAQTSAHYYLARLSAGKAISMDAVYLQINRLVTKQMCHHIPSLTGEQIDKAKSAVLQVIAAIFTQQYPADVGVWSHCKLVSLTIVDYVISATREKHDAPDVANDAYSYAPVLAYAGTQRMAY